MLFPITKLSPTARTFVAEMANTNASTNPIVTLAIAKAISRLALLPSGEVENPTMFYKTSSYLNISEIVSTLNELFLIDSSTVLNYVERFFMVRYLAAHPKRFLSTLSADNIVADFLGASYALDKATCEQLGKDPLLLCRIHNEIVQLLEELFPVGDANAQPQ